MTIFWPKLEDMSEVCILAERSQSLYKQAGETASPYSEGEGRNI